MESPADSPPLYLLEDRQVFSRSLLWDLQRAYFSGRGAEAWRLGEVPHYVTSNPSIANRYAEIVLAFWRDRQALCPSEEPLYLCELGGGSGRFAFHFLQRLIALCGQAEVPLSAFRYVLTDFAESNLAAWREHPRLRPLFDSGLLDFAVFDASQPAELHLRGSGQTLGAGMLAQPLVVIANYLFDSIPQDLFYCENQLAHACLLSLATAQDPATLDAAECLQGLRYHYEHQAMVEAAYDDPGLDALLAPYPRELDRAYVLFPAAGLRCLERLQGLSRQGLFLLSADKGEHRLDRVGSPEPPGLALHGSFSLSVNYHAFRLFCEQRGGLALLPQAALPGSIQTVGLLMLAQPAAHGETRRAWQRQVQDFGPAEYLLVSRHARAQPETMSLAQMLAYVRLGHGDSELLACFLPSWYAMAPELDAEQREALAHVLDEAWAMYFPLGEDRDLAYAIAGLLYELDDYPRALAYFEHSLDIYGPHVGTYCNMAACHEALGQPERAEPLLSAVLQTDPGNAAARDMLGRLQAARP